MTTQIKPRLKTINVLSISIRPGDFLICLDGNHKVLKVETKDGIQCPMVFVSMEIRGRFFRQRVFGKIRKVLRYEEI